MSIDVHSLEEKVGPLPIGVWLVGIGGGIAAALYLRNRGASSAAVTTTDGGTLPTTGEPASTAGGGSVGSDYYQTGQEPAYAIDQIIDRWTTNEAFNKAIAHDVQAGVTAAEHPAHPKPPAHHGSTHHAPAHKPAAPKKGKATHYAVKRGDTLTGIAHHFGTTVSHIQHLNPSIKNPNRINAGQRIRIK